MKQNIALLLGGNSKEAEISVKSASQVKDVIDADKFNVFPILINDLKWCYQHNGAEILVDKNDFSLTIDNQKITFDCVVPMIHGTPGEDGKLQSYFDLLHIPYTSCDALTMAITANKFACKTFLQALGINMPKGRILRFGEAFNLVELQKTLPFPCFIKPNNGGSSFGASLVKTPSELPDAIKKAFDEDNSEIIIEEYIKGTEISCGLLNFNNELHTLPITEIVTENEFFDLEAKYQDGKSDEITPARISENLRDNCFTISKAIYQHLNCKDIVRIDYIIRDNVIYFLEVNTVPGMSPNSIVPKQVKAYNKFTLTEVFSHFIERAIGQKK